MSVERVIYTAGVFDMLHVGHIELLRDSRALGDMLIVGVVSDDGCAAYKGRRPMQCLAHRMEMVGATRYADMVVPQATTDPSDNLRDLVARGAHVIAFTHGDDWKELLLGNETLRDLGIPYVALPRTTGMSTTRLREMAAR